MRLKPTAPLHSRDGTLAKGAQMKNVLAEVKGDIVKAAKRPGTALLLSGAAMRGQGNWFQWISLHRVGRYAAQDHCFPAFSQHDLGAMRLNLCNSLESRDGTLVADAKLKNAVVENIEGALVVVKRPGITLKTELAPGCTMDCSA